MAYEAPPSNAVNFTVVGYYEPGLVRHAFQFPSGNYAQPNGDAVHFVLTSYVYPNGLVAHLEVSANTNVEGVGAFTVEFVVEGHGEFQNVQIDGAGGFTVEFEVAGLGAHGVAGAAAFSVGFDTDAHGAHGVAGSGTVDLAFGVAGSGTVERYELTGEVRYQGVLVNRTVRAYRRDTGEFVGEQVTSVGRFKVPTGFVAREHYIIPIDPANDAEDWSPPCANRVMSVLAQDAA